METTYFLDIETSRITTDCGHEMQVTYLTNVMEMDCKTGDITNSTFFRNLADTIEYLKTLGECVVWCHNLDYELTFLLRETQTSGYLGKENKMYDKIGQEIILRDKNAPLSIKLNEIPNVTFRDSYALFNKSVSALGDELGLEKLDYDYDVVRTEHDELTQHDYDYNERDNLIVAKSLYNYMNKNELELKDVPLTFTSAVRRKRVKFIEKRYGKKSLTKFYYDRYNSFVSFSFIEDLMKVYQGGLTTSCMIETGKVITNEETSGVVGIDIKSSYPNQMCTRKFPYFDEDNTLHGTLAQMKFESGDYKHFIGTFSFTNIRVKNKKYLLPISTSQVRKGSISSQHELFNGKLISADKVTLPCTDVDLEVINKVYEYDEIQCEKITTTHKERYLRREEVGFLLSNFLNKETKKGDIKAESKLIINSMYGVKVSCPIKDFYEIIDGEVIATTYFNHNDEERERMYNAFMETQKLYGGSIDVYSDGVFITSYARKQLVEMVVYIVDNGGNVVYSDTDSIKFYCNTKKKLDNMLADILSMNESKIESNKKLPRFKQFVQDFEVSSEELNIISTLGIWEVEDEEPHRTFITYGAKKYGYITYDGKVKTTIAGCNKKNIPYIVQRVSENYDMSLSESFEFVFSPCTTFSENASGRTTAKKEKRPFNEMVGMTYKGKLINQFGGIVIKPTTYTLNMTMKDSNIIGYNEVDILNTIINKEGNVKYE